MPGMPPPAEATWTGSMHAVIQSVPRSRAEVFLRKPSRNLCRHSAICRNRCVSKTAGDQSAHAIGHGQGISTGAVCFRRLCPGKGCCQAVRFRHQRASTCADKSRFSAMLRTESRQTRGVLEFGGMPVLAVIQGWRCAKVPPRAASHVARVARPCRCATWTSAACT